MAHKNRHTKWHSAGVAARDYCRLPTMPPHGSRKSARSLCIDYGQNAIDVWLQNLPRALVVGGFPVA
jgi:hypothetical protein